MRAHHSRLHDADVMAVFENQDDADEAILRLRLAGYHDDQIGYFAQHPTRGLTDLMDHDRGFAGAVIGSVLGALLGVGAANVLNDWSVVSRSFGDFFGLAATLSTFGALFGGLIGWGIGVGIHRRAVDTPAIDPNVGPFVIAVASGDAPELTRSILHEYGGHDLPPGALMARPTMA